jgi:hypothetical protein
VDDKRKAKFGTAHRLVKQLNERRETVAVFYLNAGDSCEVEVHPDAKIIRVGYVSEG